MSPLHLGMGKFKRNAMTDSEDEPVLDVNEIVPLALDYDTELKAGLD